MEPTVDSTASPPSSGRARRSRSTRRKLILLAVLLLLLALAGYALYYFLTNRSLPAFIPPATAGAIAPPQFLYAITGSGKDVLGKPVGVAISKDGRLFVSDSTRRRVSIFTLDGRFLSAFDTISDGTKKKLAGPVHLAFDSAGNLYLTDRLLDAVYVFSPSGKYTRKFSPADPALSKRWGPLALAVDAQGHVYVSDVGETAGHKMLVFDSSGRKLAQWGKTGQVLEGADAPGSFYFPNGVAVSSSGLVFVADGNNRRIQVFDANGTFKYFIATSGVPRGLAIDENTQRLFASDGLAHQVDIYTFKGEKLVSFGAGGSGAGQFEFPNDVTLDAGGRIYVADRENHQVQVWGWPAVAITAPLGELARRWYWCLTPLLLLPLLLLRRKREFLVTPDFVDAMVDTGDLTAMTQRRLRWIVPVAEHPQYVGRVEQGVDIGELLIPEEHSDSDVREMSERMSVDEATATRLVMARRASRLATDDRDLRRLGLLAGIDVYDHEEFTDAFAKGRSSGLNEPE